MKAITFLLKLVEPLLVTQVQSGEENSAVGLLHVPGSALRGVFIERYRQQHTAADLAIDAMARRLFFDGAVCYLNAYPWLERTRLVPTPLSWQVEKDSAESDTPGIYDWAVSADTKLRQPKAVKQPFSSLDEAPRLYKPEVQSTIHIGLEKVDRRGEGNKVYRYDALAAGEVLAGAVVAETDADLDELEKFILPGAVTLGGAHLAGYGRAQIYEVKREPRWQETPVDADLATDRVVITLLSDTIVRSASGQVDGDITAALQQALAPRAFQLKPILPCYRRLRPVGGYNRKWSLPLPQSWAVQAGSVFVYEATADLVTELSKLAARGLGERCAEGYGRFAVSAQTQAQFEGRVLKRGPERAGALSTESRELAKRMANRRLIAVLERELINMTNAADFKDGRVPANAQLSRMRQAAQQAQHEKKLAPILKLLDDLRPAQRHDFEKARLLGFERVNLLDWVRERATQGDVDVQLLRSRALPEVAGEQAELTDEQRVIYTARLIDGVMHKAAKTNQMREAGQ